jgi:hypothetical protein
MHLLIFDKDEEGDESMLIQILRAGNSYDYVKDSMLDSLIESKGIVKFRRSTGWVTIGTDPIRRIKRDSLFNNTDKIAVNDSIYVREYRRDNQ